MSKHQCGCGNQAINFHSKCCMAHFKGVITENGKLVIVCEKCGKFVAYLEESWVKLTVDTTERIKQFLMLRLQTLARKNEKPNQQTELQDLITILEEALRC